MNGKDFKYIDFVEYIRNQKCIICYKFPVDPDHLISVGMGRDRKKEDLIEHLSCIPLCRTHHIERHATSMARFEEKHKVNLFKENHEYLMAFLKSLLN